MGRLNRKFASLVVAGLLTMCMGNSPLMAQVSSVWTWHYDNLRTGMNPNEVILNTSNVNSNSFGKLFSQPVDGKLYGQPLYVKGVTINGAVHNVVYVVTMHDSVYAFDADNNQGTNANPLWHVSFLGTGAAVTESTSDSIASCSDTQPEFGILGTPVIDTTTGTIYLVDNVQIVSGGNTTYAAHIHALDITSGAEKFNGPKLITATAGGQSYDARQQINRPGLLLLNGVVYASFGSHCDDSPYHGWLLGYNAANLQQQTNVFCTTPNGSEGSIWEGGCAPGVDASGNIFVLSANGTFDANSGGSDYADTFLKLVPNGSGFTVSDYFTPYNQATLSADDSDVGAGGHILLPDSFGSSAHPHLITGSDKTSDIYLVDRDNMGKYNGSNDTSIQNFNNGGSGYSSPACFSNGTTNWVYWGMVNDTLKAFAISNGLYNTNPSSQTSETFSFPGTSPSVSSNGTSNAIVWTSQFGSPEILHAYDATNLSKELYNSSQAANSRDAAGTGQKFNPPVVANGKVYYAAANGLYVYGLLNQATSTPSNTPNPSNTATHTPTHTFTSTSTFTFTPTPSSTFTPAPVVTSTWRVNSGGPAYADTTGNLWSADTNYVGGTAATQGTTIAGTSNPTLYDTQRYGTSFSYVFNVPAGDYQITLLFAETYSGDFAAGDRVFNVLANGATVLANLDIYALVGANTALNEVLNNVAPSGGKITLQFVGTTSKDGNAVVEAIQIIPQPFTPTATPTNSATSTATKTVTNTATPSPTFTPTSTVTNTVTTTRTFTPVPPTPTNTPAPPTATNTLMPPTATASQTSTSTPMNTATATRTFTPVPPTPTNTPMPPTNTPAPPTATNTLVPPTATSTNSSVPPTSTSTATNTTVPPTVTNTPLPPTVTNTPATPTVTNTPAPPTATGTNTPVPPTATSTNSPVPPTATFTPTRTSTPVPPTVTNTPMPPTLTFTPTPVPPTSTHTPVPPTSTDTPVPPTDTPTLVPTQTSTFTLTPTPSSSGSESLTLYLLSAVTTDSTNRNTGSRIQGLPGPLGSCSILSARRPMPFGGRWRPRESHTRWLAAF